MTARLTRPGLRVLAGLLLMAMVAGAQARMQRVEPGEVPELEAGEGLVVLAVDTDTEIHSVKVLKEGKVFGAGAMRDIPVGRSFALYVAPAGQYQWRELALLRNLRYELADDPDFGFKVEAGRITYAGDLLFRPVTLFRAEMGMVNRSLAAMDWLQATHPRLGPEYPFVYVGRYPDPFPQFHRRELARHPGARPHAEVALARPPAPGALPIPVERLWRPGRLSDLALNPSGNLLVLELREGEEDYTVELIDLEAQSSIVLAKSKTFFSQVSWAGDDRLILARGRSGEPQSITVVHIATAADGKRSYAEIALPQAGMVIDPLPEQPNHILFGSLDSRGDLAVHRVDVTSQATVDRFRATARSRLDTGVSNDIHWLADGYGNLRLATVRVQGKGEDDARLALMHGANGEYTEVLDLSQETGFEPVGLSFDASVIHGLSDKDRAQRDLVAFDVASRRITRTLFTKEGVDVVGPLYDSRRNVIGATYYQGGRLVSEYFETADRHLEQMLGAAFPGKTVMVVARNRDGGQLLLWVDAGDQPPRLYHMDVRRRVAALLQDHQPWLQDVAFAPSQVVRFKGNDGLSLEAFLTMPAGIGKRPLVVLPHGGPIGVADRLHFDPAVQLIASLGYAVLQVNFRGSDGYGRAFREAGHGNYGTGIEDDLDAAVRHVLAAYAVDETRMCMLGSSYGGYSSLVSAVRWPQRFRCAVSIAGVSDLALFFTASDSGRDRKTRELLETLVGNPHTELAAMQETSPLYNYEALRVPVMLVHGMEDRRVDYEHTRRMLRMLDMAGNPPVGLAFQDEGHGLEKEKNRIQAWEGVAGFLREHLGAAGAAVPVH